jgi:hypothetical protein
VIVRGTNWPPTDLIELAWNFDPQLTKIASVDVDKSGVFIATVVVPGEAPLGATYIDVGDQTTFRTAQVPFTVDKSEPAGCLDAYFIGVHGTGEGPDGRNLTLSTVIGETYRTFHDLVIPLRIL